MFFRYLLSMGVTPKDLLFTALLYETPDGQRPPFPRRTYPTTLVEGMPTAGADARSSERLGAGPAVLPVISSGCSSIPVWILRQRWRFGPPCLRAASFDLTRNSDPDAVDQQVQGVGEPR